MRFRVSPVSLQSQAETPKDGIVAQFVVAVSKNHRKLREGCSVLILVSVNRRFKDGLERTEPRHLKIDVVVRNGRIKEFRSNLPCDLRGFAGYGCIPRAFGDAVLILKGVIHGFDDAFGRNIRSGFRENKFIIGTGSERMKTLLDRDGDKVAGNLS